MFVSLPSPSPADGGKVATTRRLRARSHSRDHTFRGMEEARCDVGRRGGGVTRGSPEPSLSRARSQFFRLNLDCTGGRAFARISLSALPKAEPLLAILASKASKDAADDSVDGASVGVAVAAVTCAGDAAGGEREDREAADDAEVDVGVTPRTSL